MVTFKNIYFLKNIKIFFYFLNLFLIVASNNRKIIIKNITYNSSRSKSLLILGGSIVWTREINWKNYSLISIVSSLFVLQPFRIYQYNPYSFLKVSILPLMIKYIPNPNYESTFKVFQFLYFKLL
jgi:hypothetical protein